MGFCYNLTIIKVDFRGEIQMNSENNNANEKDKRANWLLPLLSLLTISIYYTSIATKPMVVIGVFAVVVLVGYLSVAWSYIRKHEQKYAIMAVAWLVVVPVAIVIINLFVHWRKPTTTSHYHQTAVATGDAEVVRNLLRVCIETMIEPMDKLEK